MDNQVTIHKTDGTSFQVPRSGVLEYKRMLGDKISRITLDSEPAPSVEEKVVIKPKKEEKEIEKPKVKPNKSWGIPKIQEYIDKHYPGIEYQANDSKDQLLSYIKAASK